MGICTSKVSKNELFKQKAQEENRVFGVQTIIDAQKELKKKNIILSPIICNYEQFSQTYKSGLINYCITPYFQRICHYHTLNDSLPSNKFTIYKRENQFCVIYLSENQKKVVVETLDEMHKKNTYVK